MYYISQIGVSHLYGRLALRMRAVNFVHFYQKAEPICVNPHFDLDLLGKDPVAALAADYIERFYVISKREFETKINELTLGVMRMSTP